MYIFILHPQLYGKTTYFFLSKPLTDVGAHPLTGTIPRAALTGVWAIPSTDFGAGVGCGDVPESWSRCGGDGCRVGPPPSLKQSPKPDAESRDIRQYSSHSRYQSPHSDSWNYPADPDSGNYPADPDSGHDSPDADSNPESSSPPALSFMEEVYQQQGKQ